MFVGYIQTIYNEIECECRPSVDNAKVAGQVELRIRLAAFGPFLIPTIIDCSAVLFLSNNKWRIGRTKSCLMYMVGARQDNGGVYLEAHTLIETLG